MTHTNPLAALAPLMHVEIEMATTGIVAVCTICQGHRSFQTDHNTVYLADVAEAMYDHMVNNHPDFTNG